MEFWKGQALGNDYLVVDRTGGAVPESSLIQALCDRHRGAGSDGVLAGDLAADPVGLRIFNPDGSEAEKSGNGLRIFGAWLHGRGIVQSGTPFQVALPGETVEMVVVAGSGSGPLVLRVRMGRASFRAGDVPFTAADADHEVSGWPLEIDGETVHVHPVSLGNPHCVVFLDHLDPATFRRLAPAVQANPAFPRGVNVQFARFAEPGILEAFIWERGVGETLASGSSACAVAAAARHAGIASDTRFQVRMPGGSVAVEVGEDWTVRLTGEARIVYRGETEVGFDRDFDFDFDLDFEGVR